MTGRFIVLEGGDGSGKSTQVARLAAELREQGIDVVVTRGARRHRARRRGPSVAPRRRVAVDAACRGAADGGRPRAARGRGRPPGRGVGPVGGERSPRPVVARVPGGRSRAGHRTRSTSCRVLRPRDSSPMWSCCSTSTTRPPKPGAPATRTGSSARARPSIAAVATGLPGPRVEPGLDGDRRRWLARCGCRARSPGDPPAPRTVGSLPCGRMSSVRSARSRRCAPPRRGPHTHISSSGAEVPA